MIKYIALAISILFASNANAMSFKHAKEIYNRILEANGFLFHPTLQLYDSDEINASTNGVVINLNKGMLRFVNNDAEMAMILGHEIGHFKKGGIFERREEYSADYYGAKYMQRAGYNKCQGAYVLARLGGGTSDTHPAGIDRYHRLGC